MAAALVRTRTNQEAKQDMENARDDMSAALREVYDEIHEKVTDEANTQVRTFWEIGERVDDILDNEPKYGANALEQMVTAMGKQSLAYFHKARLLYQTIDEMELRKILALRRRYSGLPITLSHLSRITGITDQRKRLKLLTDMCDQEQTWDEFLLAVDKTLNRAITERRAGGRPHAIPATVLGKVNNFVESARFLFSRAEQVWLNEDHKFSQAVTDTAPDKITPEVLDALRQARGYAIEMKALAAKLEDEAVKAYDKAEAVVAAQAEAEGHEEAEDMD